MSTPIVGAHAQAVDASRNPAMPWDVRERHAFGPGGELQFLALGLLGREIELAVPVCAGMLILLTRVSPSPWRPSPFDSTSG